MRKSRTRAFAFVCAANEIPNAPDVAKRIKFPDGRTVYVLGQNHGDRLELRQILQISRSKDLSNLEFRYALKKILDANKEAVAVASKEVDFIKDLLEKDPDLKFLGLEATSQVPKDHLKYSKEVMDNISTQARDRKMTYSSIKEQSIIGFSGSIAYLKLTQPALLKKREIFGFEDEKAADEHQKLRGAYDDTLDSIKKKVASDPEFLHLIEETNHEFLVLANIYDSAMDSKIIDAVKAKVPKKYLDLTLDWVKTALKELKAMQERDRKSVKNILNNSDSTLITIGRAHVENIAKILLEKCNGFLDRKSKEPLKLNGTNN